MSNRFGTLPYDLTVVYNVTAWVPDKRFYKRSRVAFLGAMTVEQVKVYLDNTQKCNRVLLDGYFMSREDFYKFYNQCSK